MPKPIRIGPSSTEVILGAIISLTLGVTCGALALAVKPVITVKELPKEEDRKADAIYYIEGTRDGSRGRQADAKRKAFAAGESITVNEDELNLMASPQSKTPPPKPKPKAKEKGKEESAPVPMTAEATVMPPNFRLRDGVVQIAVPTKVSVLGVDQMIVMQSQGTFVREDGRFVFKPTSTAVGSLPLDRLPFVKTMVLEKFLGAQPIPEDIATSWGKLAAVQLEGSELKLSMP